MKVAPREKPVSQLVPGAGVHTPGSSTHCRYSASAMQVELLGRRAWRTRVELANAIFEYLEIFYNRGRRHSALGMLTPVEFETRHQTATVA